MLKIPLIKRMADEAEQPLRDGSSSDGSTTLGSGSSTPGFALSPFAWSPSSSPSWGGGATKEGLGTRRRWCSPRCRASCAAACGLALAWALVYLQSAGVLEPLTRLLRSATHSGTPLPAGYCAAEFLQAPEAPPPGAPIAAFTAWAAGVAAQLTPAERRGLLNGAGYAGGSAGQEDGYYIGNLVGVPRLGIPSIHLQDAAQGFRTADARIIGQVTAWPCGLAIAASWDRNATWHWSRAIGREFRAKGANVLLGPAVNVHRVAANGRNAEYISGEDPMLGAGLAPAYVRGAQEGAGVAAVVKHFVLNQQETARMSVDSQADERTRWESYYPPFEAAVKAGVAAVMCSYNLVNGEHACENSETITTDLKGRMGFSGWVMSDWWAMASGVGASAGTDQDMPGNDGFFSQTALASLPPSRLDEMATRVLAGMARTGAWGVPAAESCRAGCNCAPLLYGANATSESHASLARTLAANSAVLLQNAPRSAFAGAPRALPLRPGERVAVLGGACAAKSNVEAMVPDFTAGDYYVVGGSGRVLSPHSVSILEGLQGRGLQLAASGSDELAAVEAALQGADMAVLCGGATSSEAVDRSSLRLDNEHFLIKALRLANAKGVPAIVVALVPGAIIAPWRKGAAAVLAMFLSGQETGRAAADVLTGAVTPSGKLPVTFPEHEADALWPCASSPWPFATTSCAYEERLKGGWHVYDGKPVAFPFGHGLSYTDFEYSVARDWSARSAGGSADWQLTVGIRNAGAVAGAEIVQLYVRFPTDEVDEPDLLLRGFEKTAVLPPGGSGAVTFSLSRRELSVWDAELHAWRLPPGRFEVFVGASSRDLRLCGALRGREAESTRAC